MWDKVIKSVPGFRSAVLTGLDADGYPLSLRCVPQLDSVRQVLRLSLPDYVEIRPGPAGVLFHFHDEQLWNLKSFVLRGKVERLNDQWVFYPAQYIEGASGRLVSTFALIRNGRRAAQEYLIKRQLPRPTIPWDKLKAIYNRSQTES